MKKETQLELFKKFTEKQLEIISSKQEDYCDTEECVLGNFKTAGANAGISTEQQILSLIATKVARLGNLFKGKVPNNESIEDSIIDMANYCFLLHCAIEDKNPLKFKGVYSDSSKISNPYLADNSNIISVRNDGSWSIGSDYRGTKSHLTGNQLCDEVKRIVKLSDNQEQKTYKDNCY